MTMRSFRHAGALALAALLVACGSTMPDSRTPAPVPIRAVPALDVDVLVLNYDPVVPQRDSLPLHAAMGWNDPRELAEGYVADVRAASHGQIRYRLVEWKDIDAFPAKVDGFRYTPESFLACWDDRTRCHAPDSLDYAAAFREHDVARRVDTGEIDEVWIFGAPFFGSWESAMAGPGAFEINGGVYPDVDVGRPFAVMGFSYERGVAEMLHNLCHRTEATMTRVFGGWEADRLDTQWAAFAASALQSNGYAAVGSCHFPPNARKAYDYANPTAVLSAADDWLAYPALTGATAPVTRESWGGPDYHRGYMRWWFARLPHAPGTQGDGRIDNWWAYVFDFAAYDEKGLPRPAATR